MVAPSATHAVTNIADDLVTAIATAVGATFIETPYEIHAQPFGSETWDIIFFPPTDTSVRVMLSARSDAVKVLCEAFEFERIPIKEAPPFLAAILTDQISIGQSTGPFGSTLTLHVISGDRDWSANRVILRKTTPSQWELDRLK